MSPEWTRKDGDDLLHRTLTDRNVAFVPTASQYVTSAKAVVSVTPS